MPPRFVFGQRFAAAFFSLLWNNAFLIACGQCIIAGACGCWYFTPNEKKGSLLSGPSPVRVGVKNCLRYHPGSMAFGAFILACVQMAKWIMYYLSKQAEAQKNKVMALVCKVLGYLIACIERVVKFLNKNAYIQIALLGKSFCKSAFNAFMLILRNAATIGILGGIGMVVYVLGTLFITVATGVLGYMILTYTYVEEISSPVVPTIVYVIMGYCSAKLIMNVFGLGVDTTLQCFVADKEMGGSGNTPVLLSGFMKDSGGKKVAPS